MKEIFTVMLLMTIGCSGVEAQVNFSEPPEVRSLMHAYVTNNRAVKDVQGWRIQIVATTDRRLMESNKQEFEKQFPDIPSSWTHNAPYYKFQAGAYSSKNEALPELMTIKEEFPKAYLVVDRISYDELNEQL